MAKKYKSALTIGNDKGIERVIPHQTGKRKDILRDAARSARMPGKRLSRNGNEYWETRKNRSDLRYLNKDGKVIDAIKNKPNI